MAGWVRRREHEADPGLGDAAADMLGVMSILTPSEDSNIGRARARRQCAIAVLGDRYARARDNERGAESKR